MFVFLQLVDHAFTKTSTFSKFFSTHEIKNRAAISLWRRYWVGCHVDCTLKDALSAACQERLIVSVAELQQVTFVHIIFLSSLFPRLGSRFCTQSLIISASWMSADRDQGLFQHKNLIQT
jgi:hypothetical protein